MTPTTPTAPTPDLRSRLAPWLPRLSMATRVTVAVTGGYVLSAACAALLGHFLPLPRVDAVLAATLLSFLLCAGAVMWAFFEARLWRVLLVLGAGSAALSGLVWLLSDTLGGTS